MIIVAFIDKWQNRWSCNTVRGGHLLRPKKTSGTHSTRCCTWGSKRWTLFWKAWKKAWKTWKARCKADAVFQSYPQCHYKTGMFSSHLTHRITEWLTLEGTSASHLVLPPCQAGSLSTVDQQFLLIKFVTSKAKASLKYMKRELGLKKPCFAAVKLLHPTESNQDTSSRVAA